MDNAIYWRTAVLDLAESYGTKSIEEYLPAPGAAPRSVRFAGLLLKSRFSSRMLAVFAGKLAWWGLRTTTAASTTTTARTRRACSAPGSARRPRPTGTRAAS